MAAISGATPERGLDRCFSDSKAFLSPRTDTPPRHSSFSGVPKLNIEKIKTVAFASVPEASSGAVLVRRVSTTPRSSLHEQKEISAKRFQLQKRECLPIGHALPSPSCLKRDPISLEELAQLKLPIENYERTPPIERSKYQIFRKKFSRDLEKELEKVSLQPIDECCIDDCVQWHIKKMVDRCFIQMPDISANSNDDLERCYLFIASNSDLYARMREGIALFVNRNLLAFKIAVGTIFERVQERTDWLDEFVKTLESLLKCNTLEFYETCLIKQLKDPSIQSFLFRTIHPKPQEAKKALERMSFWSSDNGRTEVYKQVRKAARRYLNAQHVRSRVLTFKEEGFMSDEWFEKRNFKINLSQVARSYFTDKLIYKTLRINDIDVFDADIAEKDEKNEVKCRQFYFRFLKTLYEEGFGNVADDQFVAEQVELFLQERPFLGKDLLYLGSNSAWRICEQKFREIYPLLFTQIYKIRKPLLVTDVECYMKVSSKEEFSLQVRKPYSIYPPMPNVSSDSFAVDYSHPFCAIQIVWQVDFKAHEGWSYSISIPRVQREKATDAQWKELLNILLAPQATKDLIPELPKNAHLADALKTLLPKAS